MVRANKHQIDEIIIGDLLGLSVDELGAKFDKSRHWVNRVRILPDYKKRKKELGKCLAVMLSVPISDGIELES